MSYYKYSFILTEEQHLLLHKMCEYQLSQLDRAEKPRTTANLFRDMLNDIKNVLQKLQCTCSTNHGKFQFFYDFSLNMSDSYALFYAMELYLAYQWETILGKMNVEQITMSHPTVKTLLSQQQEFVSLKNIMQISASPSYKKR